MDLTNNPISSMSNNHILCNQIGSFKASASYEQKNCSVINSKENHSCRNIVDEYLYGTDRPSRECSNSVFKYFMNNSHENLSHAVGQHVHELPNSISDLEKASQPVPPTLGKICESANSLLPLPTLQDLKSSCSGFNDGSKNNLSVERPGFSSSIELKLGQPSQKSLRLNTKCQLAIGANLNGVHEEASKVVFQDKLLHTSMWLISAFLLSQLYASPFPKVSV